MVSNDSSSQAAPPLRLAVIGAGYLSSARIYPCLHSLPVELAAVCDLDRQRAERNARRFGAGAVFTDHRRMLAEASLDAVVVCIGPSMHAQLAIEVMEAGLPVYTEKPPAVGAAEALKVLDTSRRCRQICMTGFKKRFAPVYRAARAAVDDSDFGAPSLLSIDYASGAYRNDPGDSRSQFLIDFGIHVIDLARYLLGDVSEVSARRRDRDTYAVTLVHTSGALAVLALSGRRSWAVSTEKVELTGGPGQFLTIENSSELIRFSDDHVVARHRPVFSTMAGDSLVETGFQPELEEFVSAVQTGRQPESSIASSYETMRLYEAIADAAESERTIPLAHA